ncbi:sodium:proton antiporter [Pseudomonas aeruginosa]|nr:sodium:proton antiporter [Pseudomonas aeruginosa]
MSSPLSQAFAQNFLGHSPRWYKLTVLAFLLLNPLLLWLAGPVTSAWVLVGEFIFTLAMALKCYPLQPGGLLVLEALLLGLATPEALYAELQHNFPVLLLLMFMVAGIYFMKDLLLLLFSRLLLGVRSKALLSLLFCLLAALLSAFLDALTVTAVVISVAVAFFAVYHRVASGQRASEDYDPATDRQVPELHRAHLEEFRAFLRSLLMHAAVGTALGGVCTLVGEPQNLLIGHEAGWHFVEFFRQVAPVSMPVLAAGLLTCVLLEKSPPLRLWRPSCRRRCARCSPSTPPAKSRKRGAQQKAALLVQALAALVLIVGLALHVAEVGLIGPVGDRR